MTDHTINPLQNVSEEGTAYDVMPYQSNPFSMSYPMHVSAVAQLFNIPSTDISNARILEIGCASGGNIIPLAIYHPNTTIIGVDYSKVQIQLGQSHIKELGLDNIELYAINLIDITPEFGLFDYIIAHGVYSWVPAEIQDAILRICRENLKENGIAYVSYNTYPGWKTNEITRDMMLFHTRYMSDITKKVEQGRNILQFMHDSVAEGYFYQTLLKQQLSNINSDANKSYYLAHEYLEENNSPCYFKDFMTHAKKYELGFLSESHITPMFGLNLSDEKREQIIAASDHNQINLEQYLDFISNRLFRQTLLCHERHLEGLSHIIVSDNIKKLSFSSNWRHANEKELADIGRLPEGSKRYVNSVNTNDFFDQADSLNVALFDVLVANSSVIISYKTLVDAVHKKLQIEFNEQKLLNALKNLIIYSRIKIYKIDKLSSFATTLSERPKIHPQIIKYGQLTNLLISFQHASVTMDSSILSEFINLIDGNHTKDDFYVAILDAAKAGRLFFTVADSQEVLSLDDPRLENHIKQNIDFLLNLLLNNGLMIS